MKIGKFNLFLILIGIVLFVTLLFLNMDRGSFLKNPVTPEKKDIRKITSIDTTKYSRDIAREKLQDFSFDEDIDIQVNNIALTGATHIAIGTPYDEEFLPFMKRWVDSARKHGLSVWFRGNWSGWEQWFEYAPIDRETHIQKTVQFILDNDDLFRDGDIFVACNECENGGPGDPRMNGDAKGHREFLINEHNEIKRAFEQIGKRVYINFNSMNGDVARLIMDPETTKALGGIVTVDHYVESPEVLVSDLKNIAKNSEGEVVLGEFGAPILDIHGDMTPEEQADWINQTLARIFKMPEVIAVNYWVNVGGSTNIWNEEGNSKLGVDVITNYYKNNRQKAPRNLP